MNDSLYHEQLLEEARSPQHFGTLEHPDATITEYNASCGDSLTLYVKFDETRQKISDLKWQGTGCVISQVSMSVLAGRINSGVNTKQQLEQLTQHDIEQWLGIETISPGRLKCLLLGLKGIISAFHQ